MDQPLRPRPLRCRGRLLALALMLLLTRPAVASVVVPLTLTQLTGDATLIVDGTVAEVRHVEGPQGLERLVQVRVTSTWKGQPVDTVYVHLAGGRVGRTETVVAGVPVVQPGDRLVWFLGRHPRGGHVVLGLYQGALRTQRAPDGTLLVVAPPRHPGSRGDVLRRPRSLDALAADVRQVLVGGAGQ